MAADPGSSCASTSVTREKERSARSMANYVGSARLPCASGADVYLGARSMGAQDGNGAPLPFIHRARNRYAARRYGPSRISASRHTAQRVFRINFERSG